jgi:hypothetical protein
VTNNDWEALVRALTSKDLSNGEGVPSVSESGVEELVQAAAGVRPSSEPLPASLQPIKKATNSNQDSTAESALKTVAKFSGINPVITGLFRLLGGSGNEGESVLPTPFALPRSVAVDSGLTADRSINSVSYGQQGAVRTAPAVQQVQQQTPVQITVQAIDSRSFLDHRDEIARAVREAMLDSHSLNDVVAEI